MTGLATGLVRRINGRRRLRRRIARRLGKAGLPVTDVRILDAGITPEFDLALRKENGRLDIAVRLPRVLGSDELFDDFRHRSLAIIEPFMRSNAREATGNISDGEQSGSGVVAFSAIADDAILVPDAIFHASGGYDHFRKACAAWQVDWAARDDKIVWRGSTTGQGLVSSVDMSPGDMRLLPRTRMCLALRDIQGVDARIAGVAQSNDLQLDQKRLQKAGIMGSRIDSMTWLVRKFAIDIDGNSNAWSNLFTRLLAGCCVIKIGSRFGYRQWYYDDLKPWQHYVPVAADMSDLHEKIEWCRSHDKECAEIAAAGRDFAKQRDLASEMKRAVETLNHRLGTN